MSSPERIVAFDEVSTMDSLVTHVLTIPLPPKLRPDAIIANAGMGEEWRIRMPIEFWLQYYGATNYLLIAGPGPHEQTFEKLSVSLPTSRYHLPPTGNLIVQPFALHTKDQMDWVAGQIKDLGIESAVHCCTPYHLPRAYLTLLKSLLQTGNTSTVVIPQPLPVLPTIVLPEDSIGAHLHIPGEAKRIQKYQEKGDVATLDELMKYLIDTVYPFLKNYMVIQQ